jgi:hypothetical protein
MSMTVDVDMDVNVSVNVVVTMTVIVIMARGRDRGRGRGCERRRDYGRGRVCGRDSDNMPSPMTLEGEKRPPEYQNSNSIIWESTIMYFGQRSDRGNAHDHVHRCVDVHGHTHDEAHGHGGTHVTASLAFWFTSTFTDASRSTLTRMTRLAGMARFGSWSGSGFIETLRLTSRLL